jgi:hypothetical protein
MMARQWLIGALVFVGGIGITCAGFVYDIMFAGIPFQDAPQQLQDQYEFHSNVASAVELAGVIVAAAAIPAAAFSLIRRSTAARTPTRD